MCMRDRYLVFATKTHRYLRTLFIVLVVFNFYLSSQLGYIWLYSVSWIFLVIAAISMSFLCSCVTFSSNGIKLRYGFWTTYELRWEEVQCCGSFSLKILGAAQKEEYIYFSKKQVSYSQLVTSNTLPPQSNQFIYLSRQNGVLLSVQRWWDDGKGQNL